MEGAAIICRCLAAGNNLEMSGGYIMLKRKSRRLVRPKRHWAAEFKGKSTKEFKMQTNTGVTVEWTGRTTGSVDMPGVKFDPRLMHWEVKNSSSPSQILMQRPNNTLTRRSYRLARPTNRHSSSTNQAEPLAQSLVVSSSLTTAKGCH